MSYALGWRRLPLTLAFMLLIGFATNLLLSSPKSDAVVCDAISMATGVLAIAAVLTLRCVVLPRIVVRRMLKERRSPLGEWNLLLSPQGYKMWGDTAVTDLSWGHFVRWRENAHVILLYQNTTNYTFVPKRILAPGEAAFVAERLRNAGVPQARLLLS